MNTELRTKIENNFEEFFKLINNSLFGKTMKNIMKQRDVRLVANNRSKSRLVLGPNCYTTKYLVWLRETKVWRQCQNMLSRHGQLYRLRKIWKCLFWLAGDFEIRFDTLSYKLYRSLPLGKNKKVIGLIKDELGERITKEFVALRPKMYSYLTDDDYIDLKDDNYVYLSV